MNNRWGTRHVHTLCSKQQHTTNLVMSGLLKGLSKKRKKEGKEKKRKEEEKTKKREDWKKKLEKK